MDLFEARGRLGGRACTASVGGVEGVDLVRRQIEILILLTGRAQGLLAATPAAECALFRFTFPFFQGASWIHGLNRNPVAKVCREFGLAMHGDEDERVSLCKEDSFVVLFL